MVKNYAKEFAKKVQDAMKLKHEQKKFNEDWYRSSPIGGSATGNVPMTKTERDSLVRKFRNAFRGGETVDKRGIDVSDEGLLKLKRGFGGGTLVFFILFGVFAFLLVGYMAPIPLVQSFIQIYVIDPLSGLGNYQVDGVPLRDTPEYLGCVWENSWFSRLTNPSLALSSQQNSDVFDFCKQDLLAADEIGCTECFDIRMEVPNQRVLAGTGQQALYIMRVSAAEEEFCYTNLFADQECQPLTPAADPKIYLNTNFGNREPETNLNLGGVLDPQVITDTPLTAVVTIPKEGEEVNFCDGRTNFIEAKGVIEYRYRTEGSAPIVVRASGTDQTFFAARNPISLPGPLKIDIIPDSYSTGGSYEEGLNNIAFVFIKLRNAGFGNVAVKDLTLTQIYPETRGDLKNLGCAGPAIESIETLPGSEPGLTDTRITFVGDGIRVNPSDRSSTILCRYDLTGANVPTGSSLTWIMIGEATYDYTLVRQAPNIIVDQSSCSVQQATQQTQSGEGSLADSGEGEGSLA